MTRARSRISLDGAWELLGVDVNHFSDADPQAKSSDADAVVAGLPDQGWRACEVPGTVQQALHRGGEIPDPLHGTNAEQLRWIEDWTWWYRRSFEATEELLDAGEIVLRFEGLDTFATVWLNGASVGAHENQFIPFTAEVRSLLRPGKNQLLVRLAPVAASVRGRRTDGLWQEYGNLEALHARKCQASFGWDLAPRLVTAGVWRPVSLDVRAPVNIDDLRVRTVSLSDAQASVRVDVELSGDDDVDGATLELELVSLRTAASVARQTISLERGAVASSGVLSATLSIDQPELWWPIELGEQRLYRCTARVVADGERLDERVEDFGVREARLMRTADRTGESFTFVINDVPVFCKGANWVPCDATAVRGAPGEYRSLVGLARDAGINMLRVWGGGIYEDAEFYEACDELGVLVWQDFMYSCAVYPHAQQDFARAAEREARVAVRTLRNHPSIVVWCGNNECQWLHGSHRHEDPTLPLQMPGLDFFESTLASVCAELDGTRPYIPSSPWGGEHPNCATHGDRHAYHVGFGETDDEDYTMDMSWPSVGPAGYREERPRFVSEFAAIPAPPEPEALARFLAPEDRSPSSEAWRYHLPAWPPDGIDFQSLLEFYCANLFGVPSARVIDNATWQRHARLVQGIYLELGLREFRRQWPHCGGALMWQFNSMWPSMEWGIVDYYGHAKPGYYFTKRALAPVLAVIRPTATGCEFSALAEGRKPTPIRWELAGGRFDGEPRTLGAGELQLAPREVTLLEIDVPTDEEDFLCLSVSVDGQVVSRDFHFRTEMRTASVPGASLEAEVVERLGSRARLRIRSDAFAWWVRIGAYGARCSDNYFQLEPGAWREIEVDLERAEGSTLSVSAINAIEELELALDVEPQALVSSL